MVRTCDVMRIEEGYAGKSAGDGGAWEEKELFFRKTEAEVDVQHQSRLDKQRTYYRAMRQNIRLLGGD